jgi:hypothetical protein
LLQATEGYGGIEAFYSSSRDIIEHGDVKNLSNNENYFHAKNTLSATMHSCLRYFSLW